MSKQKSKGNDFERHVATRLTEIYGQPFVRTVGSGARLGGKNKNRDILYSERYRGDIECPLGFDLIIECKHYADISWPQIIKQDCKQLDDWIEQAKSDAQISEHKSLNWWLIFRITRQGTYICRPEYELWNGNMPLRYKNYYIQEFEQYFKEKRNRESVRVI